MWAPEAFAKLVIEPGLDLLYGLGGPAPSPAAARMLLAIAQQESGLAHRYQVLAGGKPGPARGWWQFEQGGGVVGVLTHSASRALAQAACQRLRVAPKADAVWRALEGNDLLAVAFARLLLWTYPQALPKGEAEGWRQYLGLWRPGKPHPKAWPAAWQAACAVYPLDARPS